MRRRRRERGVPEMMISPMIDMMFLLLVFFIVSTMYMNESHVLPVSLPRAEHAEQAAKTPAEVTVMADGRLFLEDREVSMETLLAAAEQSALTEPDFRVVLRADGDAAYSRVIAVMDALRGAGVTRFGLAAERGTP